MATVNRILEGLWEDIVKQNDSLVGHHVKVIVEETTPVAPPQTTKPPEFRNVYPNGTIIEDDWVRRLREMARNAPPVNHFVDDSRDTIYGEVGL